MKIGKLQDFEEYVEKLAREEGIDKEDAERLRDEWEHIRDEEEDD